MAQTIGGMATAWGGIYSKNGLGAAVSLEGRHGIAGFHDADEVNNVQLLELVAFWKVPAALEPDCMPSADRIRGQS